MACGTLKIELNVYNAAFDPDPTAEVLRVLTDLADRMRYPADRDQRYELHDVNGNHIGFAIWYADADDEAEAAARG